MSLKEIMDEAATKQVIERINRDSQIISKDCVVTGYITGVGVEVVIVVITKFLPSMVVNMILCGCIGVVAMALLLYYASKKAILEYKKKEDK